MIYKIRTMIDGAEDLKSKYKHLNEYKPPIFKIHNDPRYTKIGKCLSQSYLDELPQLLNIIRGDMSFVGPRPLPVSEARDITMKYQSRFSVLPGMIPPWVMIGDTPTDDTWLKQEVIYINKKSFFYDIHVIFKCFNNILMMIKKIFLK